MPIRAGHVVVRPPGTRIAHSFRAGPDGLNSMLIYGTRKTNDMCWYPRSNKIAWRGRRSGRIESLDYYDGEPDDDEEQP